MFVWRLFLPPKHVIHWCTNACVHVEGLTVIRCANAGLKFVLQGFYLRGFPTGESQFSRVWGLRKEYTFLTLTVVSVGLCPLAVFFFHSTVFNKASWVRTHCYSLPEPGGSSGIGRWWCCFVSSRNILFCFCLTFPEYFCSLIMRCH